jgi:hypothetical protein
LRKEREKAMDNNKILEAMNRVQVLKDKAKQERKALNEAKRSIATEFAGQFSEAQKQTIIADCEKVITTARNKFAEIRQTFKAQVHSLKQDINTAKGRLELLNYTLDNGLKRAINQTIVENGVVLIKREGIADISVKHLNNQHWQKELSLKLAEALKTDINAGTIRSLVYKASLMVKEQEAN